MSRAVTEEDFRRPEFKGAKPEDYEFRDDGKIVRKDRWETGIFSIAYATGFNSRKGFEIGDVVEKVRKLANDHEEIENEIGDFMWAELTTKEPA